MTGTRVPMRITSTWWIAARFSRKNRSLAVRQRERVAAGDDHVADLRVLADVLDHPLVVAADGVPAAADHGRPLARAEPAIHGADVRGDQQGAVGIAVRQARHRRVLVLFERILQLVAGRVLGLERRGDRLQADRIVGIVGVDQREVVRRDGELVLGLQGADGFEFLVGEGSRSRSCRTERMAFCDCQRQSSHCCCGTSAQSGMAARAYREVRLRRNAGRLCGTAVGSRGERASVSLIRVR